MTDGVPARGSLRSRGAAAVSAYTLRPVTSVIPPERAWGLWLSRQIIARIMGTLGPSLAGTRVEQVDTRLPDRRRVKGEWVYGPRTPTSETLRAPSFKTAGSAIYYVHGSGYAVCSPKTHRRLTSWLSSLTGLPVLSIDYRLAPRYRYPCAADDVRAGWDWLVETCGVSPKQIVIVGDSAGGQALPPTLIQAGGSEMLQGDARQLAADIRAAGGRCELQIWPHQVHVFQALPRMTPEAAKAMAYVARFIAHALQDARALTEEVH